MNKLWFPTELRLTKMNFRNDNLSRNNSLFGIAPFRNKVDALIDNDDVMAYEPDARTTDE